MQEPHHSLFDAGDQLAMADVLLRFAAGQDLRDEALFSSVFTEDARLDFVQPALRLGVTLPTFEQRDNIVSAILGSTAPLKTTHTVTNVRAMQKDGRAELTALVGAMHVLRSDESRRLLLKNIYRCELTREAPGWRAKRIDIENVWIEGDAAVLFPSADPGTRQTSQPLEGGSP